MGNRFPTFRDYVLSSPSKTEISLDKKRVEISGFPPQCGYGLRSSWITQRNIQEERRCQEWNPQQRRCQTWKPNSCMLIQSQDHRRIQNSPSVKTTFNQLNPGPNSTPRFIKDQFYMNHLCLSIQAVSVRRGAN